MIRNETIDAILARRSIRAYKPEQITKEELETLLTCALYAPTGGNLQNSRFLVIQDPEVLEELNLVIRDELRSRPIVEGEMMAKGIRRAMTEKYHFIFHAPTLISAAAPRNHSNSMANCAAGLENIMIAAESLGLGACWSNQSHWLTGVPAVRRIYGRLGLREDEDIFGSVSVGYAAARPKNPAARKEGRVQVI
ncbi:MAG: nitroreductase family protein [Stomatobaculum sp.]|nr:nitroreductase family protein [Stomatobaculum sp.]